MNTDKRSKRRKRDVNATSTNEDVLYTDTGRPKRKCTVVPKSTYNVGEEDWRDGDRDPDYSDPPSPVAASKKRITLVSHASQSNTTKNPKPALISHIAKPKKIVDLDEVKAIYQWIDYDRDTSKVKCKICMAANLKKWYIIANENTVDLSDSLRLHELSEEHIRSTGSDDGRGRSSSENSTSAFSSATEMLSYKVTGGKRRTIITKVMYCLPAECMEPMPIPTFQFRRTLEKQGMKAHVGFCKDQNPAGLREDISKAFRDTFKLRDREVLQFDYLMLNEEKRELTKMKMHHFDAETVLSLVGDSDVFILLKQKHVIAGLNWKELLFQQQQLQILGDAEHRDLMLSVMHRLSTGKFEKETTEHQQRLINTLIAEYKLNDLHQLVYIGNDFDQLVLFARRRRLEAFHAAHGLCHFDMQTTFNCIYKHYYWNDIEGWVADQVRTCRTCLLKYGKTFLAHQVISLNKFNKDSKPSLGKSTAGWPKASIFEPSVPPVTQDPAEDQETLDNGREEGSLRLFTENNGGDDQDFLPPENIADSIGDIGVTQKKVQSELDSSHSTNIMQVLHRYQQIGKFCDFEVILLPAEGNDIIEPTTFEFHRNVLAAISSRIEEKITSNIKLAGMVSAEAMKSIVEFAYTGQISAIQDLHRRELAMISTTALALDVKVIDTYLQRVRPDFVKCSVRIAIVPQSLSVKEEPLDMDDEV